LLAALLGDFFFWFPLKNSSFHSKKSPLRNTNDTLRLIAHCSGFDFLNFFLGSQFWQFCGKYFGKGIFYYKFSFLILKILIFEILNLSSNCHNHLQYAMNGFLEFSIFIFLS
jgi:hypothetical protein